MITWRVTTPQCQTYGTTATIAHSTPTHTTRTLE
jgi:hypothetical protein